MSLAQARPSSTPLASSAHRHATTAAEAARVTVRELVDMPDLAAAGEAWNDVWSVPDGQQMLPPEVLRAMSHAGNYAAGAYHGGDLVGAAFGFLGEHDGTVHLHSHIAGVLRGTQHRGVGYAMKLHQRAWALDRSLGTIAWTFDPLVRRNAYFNLTKLAAVARDYEVDFYGAMDDGFNAGDDTDRLVVTWELTSPRVTSALDGGRVELPANAGEVILDEVADGSPVAQTGAGPVLRVRVPDDIVELRRRAPQLARSWRAAVRDTLGGALADGYTAVGVSRDGWYVLQTDDATSRT